MYLFTGVGESRYDRHLVHFRSVSVETKLKLCYLSFGHVARNLYLIMPLYIYLFTSVGESRCDRHLVHLRSVSVETLLSLLRIARKLCLIMSPLAFVCRSADCSR